MCYLYVFARHCTIRRIHIYIWQYQSFQNVYSNRLSVHLNRDLRKLVLRFNIYIYIYYERYSRNSTVRQCRNTVIIYSTLNIFLVVVSYKTKSLEHNQCYRNYDFRSLTNFRGRVSYFQNVLVRGAPPMHTGNS